MTRITSTGRDWTTRPYQANGHTDRNFGVRLPYPLSAPRSEPLWHSIAAALLLPVAVIAFVIIWSIA